MTDTARLGLQRPATSDPVSALRLALADHADTLDDAGIHLQGTLASRPASSVGSPGLRDRYYFATDTGQYFRDNGTGWDEIARVSQEAWKTLALTGWSGPIAYYKDSLGSVHARGDALAAPAGAGSAFAAGATIATLPAGYRPGVKHYFPVFSITNVLAAMVSLDTSGVLKAEQSIPNGSTLTFGAIQFRAEG